MKAHSWTITHSIEEAKGCTNRKVDSKRLKAMPHLKGTCNICVNYKPIKHVHNDFSLGDLTHSHCGAIE